MPPKPPFTFGRFRLSLQRLYLAIVRPYWPLLKYIWNLATWKDKQTSLLFCTSYWILCFYDLILPAAVFCVLYALVRRRIFPYPSLKELREHRAQLAAANQFSDEISSRLGTSSVSLSVRLAPASSEAVVCRVLESKTCGEYFA